MRARRHVRRPPDLTSLFDVLFIVVFAALIRAAAVQHAAELAAPRPAPGPSAPPVPPAVAQLRQRALADLNADLAARMPLVVRITSGGANRGTERVERGMDRGVERGMIEALEVGGKRIRLDAPLVEHSPDPDVVLAYLGDRSADLRVCRIAALHLAETSLSRYLVIMAPDVPLGDLPEALYQGLHRDLDRCLTEQHGFATLVDPAALAPPTAPHGPAPGQTVSPALPAPRAIP
jgi:hypothetical protein